MSIQQIEQNLRVHVAAMLQRERDEQDALGDDAKQLMQANAPWADQTGEARQKLAYVPDHPPALTDGGRGHLIHGADHGRFLELAHGSAYEIVQPTHSAMSTAMVAGQRQRWR